MNKLWRMRMKKIVVLLTVIVLFVGGCSMFGLNQGPTKQEMIEVLKSEEAIQVIETSLKNLDSNALTDSGVIHSYEIDYSTVKWNPMGGINVYIIVNNDKELKLDYTVNKYNNKYTISSSLISGKLSKLLENKYEN